MTHHEQVVQGALRDLFPHLPLRITETQNGHKLSCGTIAPNGKRTVIVTPATVSARHESPQYWIHRFSQELTKLHK